MGHAKEVIEAIKRSEKIVITGHRSPDGDSVGSSMAMYHLCKELGKEPIICHPDPTPSFLDWVKGDVEIVDFLHSHGRVVEAMAEADLLFALDYNGSKRMGTEMGHLFDNSAAFKIMVDHHPHPDEDFVNISISRTDVCSTCQIVFELIEEAEAKSLLNVTIGTALYLGIMTDTGSFRYSNVKPKTHEIIAELLSLGVNHTAVHENTYDNIPLNRLKLRGYAISNKIEIVQGYPVSVLWLTEEELERFDYQKGDTEGLVNIALAVEGIKVAAFFSEKDGQVKISFRSKDAIAVNQIAIDHFHGGGHVNAAGGIYDESIQSAVLKFKSLVPEYFGDLNG